MEGFRLVQTPSEDQVVEARTSRSEGMVASPREENSAVVMTEGSGGNLERSTHPQIRRADGGGTRVARVLRPGAQARGAARIPGEVFGGGGVEDDVITGHRNRVIGPVFLG